MKTYSYQEVFDASKEYFNGDELAAKVFADKYSLQNEKGEYLELTPTNMHRRLAKELARVEVKYPNPMSEEEIFSLLDRFKFVIPQGSPMSAIGNPYQVQSAGNCFVIESPWDSYGGIMKSDQELAQLMKRRAGVGLDISNIRPKGLNTKNAARTTDGIALFMERFSNTCREVAQGGRRGAEMQSISVKHPEIETFITIKQDRKKVTGANISIRLTDDFMKAVQEDKPFKLQWPVDSETPEVEKWVSATELWDKIIQSAWKSAEPGIFFWDNVIKYSPADIYASVDSKFRTRSSNPCGEIPMGIDSCRLLVINLLSFVKNPFTAEASFDFNQYAEVVVKAQRLMDDIIDLELEYIQKIINKIESDPEPEEVKLIELNLWKNFHDSCQKGRRTGLGITALGDCLAALGVKYGSEASVQWTFDLYQALAVNAYKSSCILAGERGAFPLFSHELEKGHPFLQRIWDASPEVYELYLKYGRRNVALTTTAPTGSVSTMTQTTAGIEPAFLLSYVRRKKVNPDSKDVRIDFVDEIGDSWQEFTVYHHGLKEWMKVTGETDITKSPYYGATSNDTDWKISVKLQGAAQHWVCHAISKTVNLPSDVSVETVKEIYMQGHLSSLKGLTIYRDGCRSGVLVSEETYNKQKENATLNGRPTKIAQVMAPKRPKELPCDIHHVTFKGTKWTVLVGKLEDQPYEMFMGHSEQISLPSKCSKGKLIKVAKGKYDLYVDVGGDELIVKDVIKTFDNAESAWATRMMSTAMRHGIPVDFLTEQLSKDGLATDFNKVIARIFKKYIKDGTKVRSNEVCKNVLESGEVCGSTNLMFQEGCLTCKQCGYSKCG